MKNKIYNKIWGRKKVLTTSPANQLTNLGGFTLIETLVAITLLVLAITGPLQIAANSLYASFYARDEITAYYLAVEAIEYIKNSRDSLFLDDAFNSGGNNWLAGLEDCIDPAGCYIETSLMVGTDNAVSLCELSDPNPCPYIKYSSTSGFWGYEADAVLDGQDTKFKRQIILEPDNLGGNTYATIRVIISWPSQSLLGGDKTYELTDLITNWERK